MGSAEGLGKRLPETGNVFPFSCARFLAYERRAATTIQTASRAAMIERGLLETGPGGKASF